jgi:hypothetical protein
LKLGLEVPGPDDSVSPVHNLMPSLNHISDGTQLSLHCGIELETKMLHKRCDVSRAGKAPLIEVFPDGLID